MSVQETAAVHKDVRSSSASHSSPLLSRSCRAFATPSCKCRSGSAERVSGRSVTVPDLIPSRCRPTVCSADARGAPVRTFAGLRRCHQHELCNERSRTYRRQVVVVGLRDRSQRICSLCSLNVPVSGLHKAIGPRLGMGGAELRTLSSTDDALTRAPQPQLMLM